jgi:hypothetical protein
LEIRDIKEIGKLINYIMSDCAANIAMETEKH